jgi:peptidoglycan/LPS O-acetylase OafA/YrhL
MRLRTVSGLGNHSNQRYFPHIDGLRALAILPVLLYHISPKRLPGGFAGVDVFFVISGYLITGGIINDLRAGKFSVCEFYVRRIKRIFPAYFAVICAVLSVWPFILPLNEFSSVSRSALYSAFYSANIYFYWLDSYFDIALSFNPLLHLWSLGVEEQFYLIIPFLVLFLWKASPLRITRNLCLLLIISLIISAYSIAMGQSKFAFYMLPSRAWELLAGGVLSQLSQISKHERPVFRHLLACLGLSLIGLSYLLLNDGKLFPGVLAIPSVLGAALLIRYGNSSILNQFLTWSPLVWIGQISYSLYLWHWPMNVFYSSLDLVPSRQYQVGLLVLSIAVAALSWKFIELPVRRLHQFTTARAFGSVFVGTLVLSCVCLLIGSLKPKNGETATTWRGTDTWRTMEVRRDVHRSECSLQDLEERKKGTLIPIGSPLVSPTFALWGDSHALAILPGIDALAEANHKSGFFVNLKQNFTLWRNIGSYPYDPQKDREPVLEWLENSPNISSVYLVNYWGFQIRNAGDVQEVMRICKRLSKAGKRVYFFRDVPLAEKRALYRLSWGLPIQPEIAKMTQSEYEHATPFQTSLEDNLIHDQTAIIVPIDKAFWNRDAYYTATQTTSFYSDISHLNEAGAVKASSFVSSVLWP